MEDESGVGGVGRGGRGGTSRVCRCRWKDEGRGGEVKL